MVKLKKSKISCPDRIQGRLKVKGSQMTRVQWPYRDTRTRDLGQSKRGQKGADKINVDSGEL